ncbi:hypothetical protein [Aquimarina pacifica]|uniref:hypothetical protein n=1 Tax=Aquimarina pacifica TaxID=1296415 RepID=UPI00046E84CD|nr:hypothetical protein [Aquimarina pacifica]
MSVLAELIEQEFTESGVFPLGFLYASVKNVGTTTAIVNGLELEAGEAKDYPFVGKPYPEKPFDPQDSTLYVMCVY